MLRLHAFGEPLVVSRDGERFDDFTRKTKRFALLIYLVCDSRGEPHRRDRLIATFWPEADCERGRNALRQALFVIRDELGEAVIHANGSQELLANPSRIGCDVVDFESALRSGRLEEALALYDADFLEGFRLAGCPEFDSWMESRRFKLLAMASAAARNLAHVAEGDRDLTLALHWWRRALALRPYDEGALRRIMALLASSGNRGEAASTFERFRRRILADLEIEPSRETLEFAKALSVRPSAPTTPWIGDRRHRAHDPAGPEPDGPQRHWRRADDRGR